MFETFISYSNEKPNDDDDDDDDVLDIHQWLYLPKADLNTKSEPKRFYGGRLYSFLVF